MSKRLLNLCLSLFLCSVAGAQLNPTTTLATETGNNTSASNSFLGQTNGNPSGGNVSKLPVRSLLYPGSTTKMFVHFMPWFGKTNHLNIGYNSNDPVQIARQVNDMISRGYDGLVVDWYGPNNFNDVTTLGVKAEAAKHPGFLFAVTEDKGAISSATDKAGKIISDLNYAYTTYYSSPNYLRDGDRPVVFFFGVDSYPLDWTRIRNGVKGNPLFIFRQSSSFTHAQTDGGFSWIGISSSADSMGLGYLDGFYSTSLKYPTKLTFGAAYKGFDDTLASWGSNRIVNQHCGLTWLATFSEAAKYYSASKQLKYLVANTWNDYEEGSEIETGVDNCVSVTGRVSGDMFSADIVGNASTVDHYTAFISPDGVNLTVLADNLDTPSIDLSTFTFPNGTYQMYMKAVAKSGLFNHMSPGATYNLNYILPTVALNVVSQDPNTSPVRVLAQGVAGTNPVNAMILYVDGIQVYKISGPQMDRWICLPAGPHSVTVNAWDTRGRSGKTSVSVTIN
jgi:hypothetical protein